MNTTKLGSEFEKRVYSYFQTLLEEDKIPSAPSKYSMLFFHKRYTCGRTGRIIETDISIETYNPYIRGNNEWSTLIIIECKCYNKKVDISDYDEFRRKLTDISEYGIKGILVTTKGFSRQNIVQAQKEKIALLVLSEEKHEWLVGRCLNKYPEQLMPILLGEQSIGLNPVAYYEGRFLSSHVLLNELDVALNSQYKYYIPYLSNNEIKDRAERLYRSHSFKTKDIAGEILATFYPEIRIRYAPLTQGLLGTIDFKHEIITLSNDIISNGNRTHFTLAHEIGHIVLHLPFLKREFCVLGDYIDISRLSDRNTQRMEYQANVFASYLLLPQKEFENELALLFKEYYIRKGYLYLDSQSCNKRDVGIIIKKLSLKFGVSQQVVAIRLKSDKRLIIDDGFPQRIDAFLGETI